MADTINTATIADAFLPESSPFTTEPWTSFYRAGETMRELRKGRDDARTRPEGHHRDEEAVSRMDDEGCPNERTTSFCICSSVKETLK